MRFFVLIFVILVQYGFIFGQDGSDISYVETEKLDQSYIGRRLHIDFGQRSFGGFGTRKSLDTVAVDVNGRKIKFIEHRVDNGFNNWFSQQYLESVEEVEGLKLRITYFELLEINENDILVKAFFAYIDKKGRILPGKSFTKVLSFEKKEITEFLFKAKD